MTLFFYALSCMINGKGKKVYQNYLKGLSKCYPVLSAAERPNEEAAQPDIEEYKKLQYYQLFEKQD